MPRNLNNYVYLSVPIRKGSDLYQRLKDEAQQMGGNQRAQIGPYVAALLEDRDRQLYGDGKSQALWFLSHPTYLTSLMEGVVQKAMVAAFPSLLSALPNLATHVQPSSVRVEASPEEAIEMEAKALAA